jgi:hypothetical protein
VLAQRQPTADAAFFMNFGRPEFPAVNGLFAPQKHYFCFPLSIGCRAEALPARAALDQHVCRSTHNQKQILIYLV